MYKIYKIYKNVTWTEAFTAKPIENHDLFFILKPIRYKLLSPVLCVYKKTSWKHSGIMNFVIITSKIHPNYSSFFLLLWNRTIIGLYLYVSLKYIISILVVWFLLPL